MPNRFLDICATGVTDLRPYVPGKPIESLERELGITQSIKLASNENPLGPSPKAKTAIAAALEQLARYPDGGGHELRQALAAHHGVSDACVTLGNGSNDVLDLVARVFLSPGVESLFSEHAFAVYRLCSQAVGADLRVAPASDYGHDLQAFADAITTRTRVIWIANPNNPTGGWLARGELRGFLEQVPEQVIVVVDEAYFDYVEEADYPDSTRWLGDFPNLLVTRTFSKAYGLAGLRVGYGLSHPDVADLLNRVRQPFNLNSLAQKAAVAALADQAHVRAVVELTRTGLQQLVGGVSELGLGYIPSVGNFLSVDFGRPAHVIDQALLQRGIITRPITAYGLPRHLRISVGLPEENRQCLSALREALGR